MIERMSKKNVGFSFGVLFTMNYYKFYEVRRVYNFVGPLNPAPTQPQTYRVSAYIALAQHSLWGIAY